MQFTNKVIEPNFEGEEMKLPTVRSERTAPVAKNQSLLTWPIIILLFLILIAILGGLYYWYILVTKPEMIDTLLRPTAEQNNEPESTTAEARTGVTDVVSTSDEPGAIRADLTSTQFEDIDTLTAPIESELNAAVSAKQ